MPTTPKSRAIQVILWLLPLVPVTSLAYHYDGLNMYMIAGAIQAELMAVAARSLGLGAAKRGVTQQRVLASAAALLVAAGAMISLGWNMGAATNGRSIPGDTPGPTVPVYGAVDWRSALAWRVDGAALQPRPGGR